ncbi:hypothetical protein ACP70R_023858 [Stipagrostis hirtigluma subsp. patula]
MAAGGAGEVRHWNAAVNGVSLHVAEQGPAAGPAVLLLHGFPELWLSWRHQMAALAARGFRALAPDLRGYGDSDVPADPAAYTIFDIVGDLVALLDHLRLPKVFVVGHDWGSQVAWNLSLFRPDRVRAVVALGIPFFPRGPRLTEPYAALGDRYYIVQFQVLIFLAASITCKQLGFGWQGRLFTTAGEPGRAEKAFGRYDVATVLKKFYSIEIDELVAPPGVEIIDFLQASSSPLPWMTEEELGQFAEKFQKSGFTGPLNYYRMLETDFKLTAPWSGAKITVPAKFILPKKDIGLKSFGTEQYVKSGDLKANVPDLEIAIIEGHHFVQQEQAERVNTEILSYFEKFITSEKASA